MTKLYDDYCSKEVTDLLLEKGFSDPTKNVYVDKISYIVITHQLAMKWLREEKSIYVYVEPYIVGDEVYYLGRVFNKNKMRLYSIDNMTSYSEAIEERIKYSLVNLI